MQNPKLILVSVALVFALTMPHAGRGAPVLDDGLVRLEGKSFCDDAGPFLGLGLGGGVTLQARRPVRFQVFNPLTGAVVSSQTLSAGDRLTLPQGPGAYICEGSFLEAGPPHGPDRQRSSY